MTDTPKPLSALGIVSATLSLTGVAVLATVFAAAIGFSFGPESLGVETEASAEMTMVDGMALVGTFLGLAIEFVALVIGMIGVFQKTRDRVPAVIGTCMSAAIFLLLALLVLLAWLDGAFNSQAPAV